jgi:hypothetical protein
MKEINNYLLNIMESKTKCILNKILQNQEEICLNQLSKHFLNLNIDELNNKSSANYSNINSYDNCKKNVILNKSFVLSNIKYNKEKLNNEIEKLLYKYITKEEY